MTFKFKHLKKQKSSNINKSILILLIVSSMDGWCIESSEIDAADRYKKNFNNLILRCLTLKCMYVSSTSICVDALTLLPNGDLVAGLSNGMIQIWNPKTAELKHYIVDAHEKTISHIIVSDNGDIITASDDAIKIWNSKTYQLKSTLISRPDSIGTLNILSNGDIVTSSYKTIKIWDIRSGILKLTWKAHKWITDLVISSNDDIITSSKDKTIKIWDQSGKLKLTIINDEPINKLAILPNGDIASIDKVIKIWDSKTGRLKNRFGDSKGKNISEEHTCTICQITTLPNGDIITTACCDHNRAKVWNSITGQLKFVFDGHLDHISSLTLLPDGNIVAVAYNTIKIWDSKTGRLKNTLIGHRDEIKSLIISPDGNIISGAVGAIKIWQIK